MVSTPSTTRTATKANSQVLVGGKVLLRIDNKIVGFANSATCSDDYGLEPVNVLGQLQAIDYVPTRAQHRIELDIMVLRNDSLIKANIIPAAAGNFGYLNKGNALADVIGDVNSMPTDLPAVGAEGSLRVLHGIPVDIDILVPPLPGQVTSTAGVAGTTPQSYVPVVVTYKNCYYDSGSVQFQSNRVIGNRCVFYALDRRGWTMGTPQSMVSYG